MFMFIERGVQNLFTKITWPKMQLELQQHRQYTVTVLNVVG